MPSARRDRIQINATVPAVPSTQVPDVLARFPGARTAKVKVAEPGQTLHDVARVNAVRAAVPTVRVDANGGWNLDEAVRGGAHYRRRPAGIPGAAMRQRRGTRGTAPPHRRAGGRRREHPPGPDPLQVVAAGAADVAVLKVAPLGGVSALLRVAGQLGIPVVVSSALDSAVGIGAGLMAAGALPELRHACGLGTGGLFVDDVAAPAPPVDGYLPVRAAVPDPARLAALRAPAVRRDWWLRRIADCHPLLPNR